MLNLLEAKMTLDLDKNTSAGQREKFNKYLEEELWIKIGKVTTTWCAGFGIDWTEEEIISALEEDVSNAVAHAGIIHYNAVVHVGPSEPTLFTG